MYCKFMLTCKACGCRTEVSTHKHTPNKQIVCQNCRQPVAPYALELLDNALNAIEILPDDLVQDEQNLNWHPENEGFTVALALPED